MMTEKERKQPTSKANREDEMRYKDEKLHNERQRELRRNLLSKQKGQNIIESQIQESTARTLREGVSKEEKSIKDLVKKDGGVYINGNAIVNDYYRNLNAARHSEQHKGDGSVMEKYKKHENIMKAKVQEHVKGMEQSKIQGHERQGE